MRNTKLFLFSIFIIFLFSGIKALNARYIGQDPYYIKQDGNAVSSIKDLYIIIGDFTEYSKRQTSQDRFYEYSTKNFRPENKQKFYDSLDLRPFYEEGATFYQGLTQDKDHYKIHVLPSRDVGQIPDNSFILHFETSFAFIDHENNKDVVAVIKPKLGYLIKNCSKDFLECLQHSTEASPYVTKISEVFKNEQKIFVSKVLQDFNERDQLIFSIKSGYQDMFKVLVNFYFFNYQKKK